MQENRVKKRAPAACVRCRKQKIRCSGTAPCAQCSRRSHHCVFDSKQSKVLVSQSYLVDLERRASGLQQVQATQGSQHDTVIEDTDVTLTQQAGNLAQHNPAAGQELQGMTVMQRPVAYATSQDAAGRLQHFTADDDNYVDGHDDSATHRDSRLQPFTADDSYIDGNDDGRAHSMPDATSQDGEPVTAEPHMTNPLDPSNSEAFTVNSMSKPVFLGVSSSWSFGRRVLSIVHERVHGNPPSSEALFFEGSTYDLGWNGQRDSSVVDTGVVPAPDFALFLINAVKFHCGQLFHLFEETSLMEHFGRFYQDRELVSTHAQSWYVHFLLILALGQALLQVNKSRKVPGTQLFVQAIKLLPNITSLWNDPLQSTEILCCMSLFYQCLDNRSAAYNMIGQAMRIALEQGMHTDMRSQHLSVNLVERCRAVWWTVYVLDRQMTASMGVPVSISDEDVSAPLPSFERSSRKAAALSLQVKLAKAVAVILQTVYRKSSGQDERFLNSMKAALRTIGEANEERNDQFPLDLKNNSTSICRLSAYLHLLHHQALMLATRPLLYSFLQRRLGASRSLRISTSRGARSLIRVCVSSAQQCLTILEALQAQSLLESFLPYDREAAVASGLVIVVAHAVDSSLVRDRAQLISITYDVLGELTMRGNMLAEVQKRELEQVDVMISNLEAVTMDSASQATGISPTSNALFEPRPATSSTTFDGLADVLGEWNSEDELSGERLLLMADSLDLNSLNWFMTETL